MAHDWADREATRKSYELIARYVMPHFQGSRQGMVVSRDWAAENRGAFIGATLQAIMTQISRHAEEQEQQTRKDG
jgi:limonene 1,2-monooxygenase